MATNLLRNDPATITWVLSLRFSRDVLRNLESNLGLPDWSLQGYYLGRTNKWPPLGSFSATAHHIRKPTLPQYGGLAEMLGLAQTPGRACREEQYNRRCELLGIICLPLVTPYPLGLAARKMLAASAAALHQALHSGRPEVVGRAARCYDYLLADYGVLPAMCSGFFEAKERVFRNLVESGCDLRPVAEGCFRGSGGLCISSPFIPMSQARLTI
jgi:hypothetical protein